MMNKKTILSIAVMLALAGTANAYASSTASALTAKTGVAAQSADAKPEEKGSIDAIQAEIDRLSPLLKPGEAFAYYVSDTRRNPTNEIEFVGKGYSYSIYADFAKKLKELQGPSLSNPSYLPKGYKFAKGNVFMATPERNSDAYVQLKEELQEKAANGNGKVYTKRIKVDKALGGMLIYEKGTGNKKQTIMVTAIQIPPPTEVVGGTPVPFDKPASTTEKIAIKDTEAVYTFDPKAAYKANLSWTDEEHNVKVQIFGQRSQDKKELIKIATSMLG